MQSKNENLTRLMKASYVHFYIFLMLPLSLSLFLSLFLVKFYLASVSVKAFAICL